MQLTTNGSIAIGNEVDWWDTGSRAVQAVEGLLMIATNGLVVCAIALNKSLRSREYTLVGVLSLADAANGLARLLVEGAIVLAVLSAPSSMQWLSPADCLTVGELLFVVSTPLQGVALLAVSLERLVALFKSDWYWNHGAKFGRRATYGIGGVALLTTVAAVFANRSQPTAPQLAPNCDEIDIYPFWFYAIFWFGLGQLGTFGSVLVYAAVMVLYRRKKPIGSSQSAKLQHEQRQRRVTLTLGISSLLTLALVCIPLSIIIIVNGVVEEGSPLGELSLNVLFPVVAANAIVNVFIYGAKQKEMRVALLRLLRMDCSYKVTPSSH